MKKLKQWSWVKGTDRKYKIYRNGDLYIVSKKRMALPYKDEKGYLRVYCNGKNCRVHVLVAEHHVPLPRGVKREEVEVNHGDLDRANPHADNLSWTTHSKNLLHRSMGKKRGVTERGGKFIATITIEGKTKHLGTFQTKTNAYRAYERAYVKQYNQEPW